MNMFVGGQRRVLCNSRSDSYDCYFPWKLEVMLFVKYCSRPQRNIWYETSDMAKKIKWIKMRKERPEDECEKEQGLKRRIKNWTNEEKTGSVMKGLDLWRVRCSSGTSEGNLQTLLPADVPKLPEPTLVWVRINVPDSCVCVCVCIAADEGFLMLPHAGRGHRGYGSNS